MIDFLEAREGLMARFDLTDLECDVIHPLLPTKVRGVKRVDDRRVLNGILWRLRTGALWADIPARYGPYTTCVNRFNRWGRAGHGARILQAVSEAYDGDIQMIDRSSIRVHQHGANGPKKGAIRLHGSLAGRADREESRAGRRSGPSDPPETHRRTGPRRSLWERHGRWPRHRPDPARRPGL